MHIDCLKVGGLTLRGLASAGRGTCVMVPELGVMFDVGVPVPGMLRYRTILVTHGHQDHLGGLPYLVSQHHLMGSKPPTVHLPREILAPMRRILEAWSEIEDFPLSVDLEPHDFGDQVVLRKDLRARSLRARHRVPGLAWVIERTTAQLRPQYLGCSGPELAALRRAGMALTEPRTLPLLGVTGDTGIELLASEPLLLRCRVLLHEVTGWDARCPVESLHAWGHTHLDELLPYLDRFEGEALVLCHRSTRYSRAQAQAILEERLPPDERGRVHLFG